MTSARESSHKPNRLAQEKSPYLLQHADNPVDWYPWGDEAFEKARTENKPIFLSIGYSTCHWCHVMEHESFEDTEVAKLLNETFVSIKVDREERPDIDNVYMTVCQMMTGSGGWPLTIIMTPDKKPFFAATYIPKHERYGRPGMIQIIPRIGQIWKERRAEIEDSAEKISGALQEAFRPKSGNALDETILKLAYNQLAQRYDTVFGGFGNAPKFPTPHQFTFLLTHWKRTKNPQALNMVEKTLQAMRRGGIYDHLGYGFHRYSTDREWLVPHFEKMLYDQALLTMAYSAAYQATGNEWYAGVAGEIITYVLRDMTSPQGAFFSAEDADSEGEEGKFYVWTADEIVRVLGKEDAELFGEVYNVEEKGNFIDQVKGYRTEENILHLRKSLQEIATGKGMKAEELAARIEPMRKKLFEHRKRRVHPYKDDKILTDWNGLMIAALARASQAMNRPDYAEAAVRSADFILRNLRKTDGELMHRFRDGEAGLPAHVDDYAFLTWGLLELYEATFEPGFLKTAIELNDYLLRNFWDEANGGFYFTSSRGEKLLTRSREIYDGAIPSGNSVAMGNLLRLSRMTGNLELEKRAEKLEKAFSPQIAQVPSAHTQLLNAIDFRIGPSYEIVIAGNPRSEDTLDMLRAVRNRFLPNKVLLLRPAEEEDPEISRIATYSRYQKAIHGTATAYVCENFVCNKPTTDVQEMIRILEGSRGNL